MLYSRLKINFLSTPISAEDFKKNFLYDNRYSTYSALLKVIKSQNKKLAEDIHENRIPRAFLFSNFIFPNLRGRKFNFHLYLTSSYSEVFSALLKGFSKLYVISINNQFLYKANLEIERYDISNIDSFTFLSPFILRDKEGKTTDLQDSFSMLIKEQIKRVADALYESNKIKSKIGDFDVVLNTSGFKKKLFKIKKNDSNVTSYRAWSATSANETIKFEGKSKDLAKAIALYYGVGDKTNFGFGMLGLPKGDQDAALQV
jgi:CRISPR-associated endoribonuclease Cas6